ncbi:hypothetical protein [Chryseobacterium sp.]|uniref:hypothetical protein n=1 Tax=Chryseobacterium sp. TaxID=1871047 RepID=UPI0011C7D15C|nr:hypothetical protein [Chryseobacterium sp.]TXF79352.1 hypothetical protein FUA25_02905 [Chryseobacterium sp.]
MLHKLILTGASVLTLAMCSTKNTEKNSDLVTTSTENSGSVKTLTPDSTSKEQEAIAETDAVPEAKTPKEKSQVSPGKHTGNVSSVSNPNVTGKSASRSVQSGKRAAIFFKEGENRFLSEYEMNVTFKKMTEDSRCPTGVNCIWQGVATAEIELMGTYTRPRTITLSTLDMPSKGYSKSTLFNGYRITLVNVEPYPTESRGFKSLSGNYKIGITIVKDGSNTIDPTARGGATRK